MNDKAMFRTAVRQVIDYLRFDIDNHVQVFETNIRIMAGLVSSNPLSLS
jgi:hypothetical protein